MTHRIQVRSAARQLVGEIEDCQRLELRLRFNRVGFWRIDIPGGTDQAALLLADGAGVVVSWAETDTQLLSGRVDTVHRVYDQKAGVLQVSGHDDTQVLAERLALPEAPAETTATSTHDVRTGVAETVLRQYVDNNAGPSAVVQRRVAGLTVPATAGLGSTITGRARFNNLLELLQELAVASSPELGFRVVQSGTDLVFQVYQPTDRTTTALFSAEIGNLAGYDYELSGPEANFIYCGGGGEGTARTFRSGQSGSSVVQYGRRELFRDRRDTTVTTELDQTVTEELAKRGAAAGLDIEPIDTTAVGYPADYGLGDRVTAVVDGITVQQIVREVALVWTDRDGLRITPTLASASHQDAHLSVLAAFAREQRRRASNLERR